MDSEILAVAEEVAMFIETQSIASNEQISLPTAITLYRIGRILYACIVNGHHTSVIDTFDTLMSALTLNGGYIRTVLLHELHLAYANLIVSFAANAKSSAIYIPDESSLGLLMAEKTKYANNITICTANDVIEATESLCGIYLASETACRYCGSFESSSNETSNELDIVFISFAWVYEYFLSSDQSMIKIKENILKTISRLLVHGVVPETSNISEDEQLSSIMNTIQRIQSSGGEDSCAMGDMLRMEENCQDSFVKFLLDKFSDGAQLQYTMAMLRGFPHSDSKPSVSELTESKLMPSHEQISPPQKQNMTDIQIAHVRSVLPNLGEGFIEEALKCYNNDIERTLDALIRMSDDVPTIHSRLLSLPKNLPRKLKDMPEQYTANIDMHRGATIKDDGKEHVKRQKLYIKEVERQAEEEAYLVENVSRALGGLKVQEIENEKEEYFVSGNEYDDDYDDQYDGIGDDGGMAGGIGGMDEGLYDVDVHNVHQKYDKGGARNEQDMWRQYNKLIKNVDAESQFWEESRNLNRQNKGNSDNKIEQDTYDDNDGEKKYRGPDKGKKGRLIGPDGKYLPIQRGGKKGRGGVGASRDKPSTGRGSRGGATGKSNGSTKESQKEENDKDLSKIQKRRKNDNKAKIGNHHRKDRAIKKAAGGMC